MRSGAACIAVILLCVMPACRPSTVTEEALSREVQLYASRAAFGWENLEAFQLRGNARFQGSNLVARGPFVLWGDARRALLRGDFYGPDGRPVVSARADSTGLLVYLPQEGNAFFMPEGLHAGSGTIPVRDLIHLLRTGYPLIMESWQIVDLARTGDNRITWLFTSPGSDAGMLLQMERGRLFPTSCTWDTGEFTINAASPHGEYRAWPWSWSTRLGEEIVNLELTDVNAEAVPWEGIWDLNVPVPVDTLERIPGWRPSEPPLTR